MSAIRLIPRKRRALRLIPMGGGASDFEPGERTQEGIDIQTRRLVREGKLISPLARHYREPLKLTYLGKSPTFRKVKAAEVTGKAWIPQTPYNKDIESVFGENADAAKQILYWKDEAGKEGGENLQYRTGIEADWVNPETGLADRGLFRIWEGTFNDFIDRKKKLLNSKGIHTYEDLLDPVKNIWMAKFIFDEQTWDAWEAAPEWLLSEKEKERRKRRVKLVPKK